MAGPQTFALAIYRGDSYDWSFHLFTDQAATDPYDLTGATAKAEIRLASGTTVLATLECEVIEPNEVHVRLDPDDSAALSVAAAKWDLQLTWAGPPEVVKTVLAGAVTVTPDITDSTGLGLLSVEPEAAPTGLARAAGPAWAVAQQG